MSKSSASSNKKKTPKINFKGFLSVALNRQEKKYVKDNPLDSEQLSQFLHDAAFIGYKVSVSWHPEQDCYTVTLYGNKHGHPDAGYAMSIRHRDLITAFTAMHWCLGESGKEGSFSAWVGDDDELGW